MKFLKIIIIVIAFIGVMVGVFLLITNISGSSGEEGNENGEPSRATYLEYIAIANGTDFSKAKEAYTNYDVNLCEKFNLEIALEASTKDNCYGVEERLKGMFEVSRNWNNEKILAKHYKFFKYTLAQKQALKDRIIELLNEKEVDGESVFDLLIEDTQNKPLEEQSELETEEVSRNANKEEPVVINKPATAPEVQESTPTIKPKPEKSKPEKPIEDPLKKKYEEYIRIANGTNFKKAEQANREFNVQECRKLNLSINLKGASKNDCNGVQVRLKGMTEAYNNWADAEVLAKHYKLKYSSEQKRVLKARIIELLDSSGADGKGLFNKFIKDN